MCDFISLLWSKVNNNFIIRITSHSQSKKKLYIYSIFSSLYICLICISSILKICTGITAFWKVLYMYIIIYLSFECIYLLQIHVYPFSIVICIYGYKSCCLYICEFSQMANCKYIRFILHVCLNPVMFRQSRFSFIVISFSVLFFF